MKGNLKKILAAVLALTLVLSVAGCKKDEGLNEDGTYTVVWYDFCTPQKDTKLVIDELNKDTKEKIGVIVDYAAIAPSEYAEKTQLLFSSRKKIDLCFASTGTNFEANARQSAYIDMSKLLDTVGKPTKDLLPDYALDCFKVGGVQYGIPVLKDWSFQPYINVKAEKAERLGLTEDIVNAKSLSDFTAIIEKASAQEKANYGNYYGILMRGNHTLLKFLPQETIAGSILAAFEFDNYDTVVNAFETDEFKEFAALMHDWYKKGYIKNDAATSTSDSDLWKIGNYLGGHSEYLPGYMGYPGDTNLYGNGLTTPRMSTQQISAAGMAIPSTTKNPEKTMEFVNLLYTDADVRNLLDLGIKDKHWVENEDGTWGIPEGFASKAETGWESLGYTFGNRFLLKVQDIYPTDLWDQIKKFDEESIKSGALGFSFDPAPVAGQIAAVQNAYSEYMPSILVGAVDPATALPEAIEAMNAVGAREIIAEAQRQYDEWRKNK